MRKKFQYTDAHIEKVREMFVNSFTKKQIAEATGLSTNNIWYIVYDRLKLHLEYPRIKKPSPPVINEITPNLINRVIVLTNWGYHIKEIAEDQKVSCDTVRKILKEAIGQKKIQKQV
jgi:orotate phosphoribosyltransferase-like protein